MTPCNAEPLSASANIDSVRLRVRSIGVFRSLYYNVDGHWPRWFKQAGARNFC